MKNEKKQPLLSVVVAAYNIEGTIDRIFDHLLEARHRNETEVVIVNDGSNDRTSELARGYAQRFPDWVRVVNKPNGGHGSALTAGFQVATGKYCRPLDGDDWLDPKGLDTLLEYLSTHTADMVICDNIVLNLDTDAEKRNHCALPPQSQCSLKNVDELEILPNYHMLIFTTEILKRIPAIDQHCFYVDNEYDAYPLIYVKTVVYLPFVVYVHTVGNEEQSTSFQSLVRNEANIRTVFYSLLRYCHNPEYTDNPIAMHLIGRYAADVLRLFIAVAFVLPSDEGKTKLHALFLDIKRQYPQYYRSMNVGIRGDVYRKLHCHGYELIRRLLAVKNGNKSIVW